MSCGFIKKSKPTRICTGDKDTFVSLHNRDIKANETDWQMDKTLIANIWAMIETYKPYKRFAGSNTERNDATHRLYVDYRDDFGYKQIINWNGQNYEIKDMDNIDEENITMILYIGNLGNDNLANNYEF